MQDNIATFMEGVRQLTPAQIAFLVAAMLVFWFIPTFLGFIRNRRHIGKIFLLNIPAGLTFTSYFLLMGLVLIKFDDFAELKNRFMRRRRKNDVVSAE
mgnify:CR=1 FL=1